jgi:hypothetical protein
MKRRNSLTVAVVAVVALAGSLGARGAPEIDPAAPNCVGQHVSMMARMHGGIAAATEHHNQMHGTDWTVQEHMAHVREMCNQ